MAGAGPEHGGPRPLSADEHVAAPSRLHRPLRTAGVVAAIVLGALVLTALIPYPVGDLAARPKPADGYDAAIKRFDAATMVEGRIGVLGQCRSRLITHGEQTDVVVVLFHGWTNCPRQFDELGQRLFDAGANVLILRAPRHGIADASGTRIGGVDLVGQLSPEELRDYADTSIDIADGLGRRRRVLGLSMGGVLAAWVAQNRPDVERAVVVSPAFGLHGMPGVVDYAFRSFFGRMPDIAWGGRDAFKLDHAYAGISTHSLASVYRLGQAVREQAAAAPPAAPAIRVDTNANDQQVGNGATASLVADWRAHGADVRTYEFPASDGLLHDIIDVQQQHANPDLVYPILVRQLGFGADA
ncbi:MAG: alpha/beta hydrolase [Gaiellales bacterium]